VVPLSKNKEPVRVTAPLPEHLRARMRLCGWNGDDETPGSATGPAAGSARS